MRVRRRGEMCNSCLVKKLAHKALVFAAFIGLNERDFVARFVFYVSNKVAVISLN
jgi:hypothetical protein